MKADKNNRLDPDVRFLLANERTLLAWVRTSIALEAGGIALTQLRPTSGNKFLGIVILLLGAVVAIMGYHRFIAADRAIRSHSLPKVGFGPTIQVVSVVVVAVILAIAELNML